MEYSTDWFTNLFEVPEPDLKHRGNYMNFSKEFVENKILPPLFFNRKGDKLFDLAMKYFNENDTNIDSIIHEFRSVDFDNTDFWMNIINILSFFYENEIDRQNLSDLLKSDFDGFLKKLLSFRFEYEFMPDDEICLTDGASFDVFINTKFDTENNIIINDDNITQIFSVNPKHEKGYKEPFQPGELKFYPITLIKFDKYNNKVLLNGYKRDRTRLFNQINDFDENVISKENVEELSSFKFDISNIFATLRDKGFYLKNIKYHSSFFNLNLSATSNNLLEISEFINPELILHDVLDFLKLKQMKFDYYFDGEKNIPLNLVVENYNQRREGVDEKYFKIILKVVSRRKDVDLSEIEQSIIKELKAIGIEINKAYNMPNSYYFDNFIHAEDESRPRYLEILKKNPEGKQVIDKLLDNNILSDDGAKFDYDKYLKLLYNILSSLKGERIKVKDEYFEILEINKKKRPIRLRIKIYSDSKEKKYTDYYSVIIPFGSRLNKVDKIYNIILADSNEYKILLYNETHGTEVLNELYNCVKVYLLYHYKQLLGKEANNSHHWLVKYVNNPFEFKDAETPTKSGYTVENHVNIILKLLFGNYLAVGGKNKPDGILGFDGNIAYVIDSKQHQNLEKSELTKLRDYIHSYRNDESIYNVKGGILIICKKILKNGSLNPSSRKEVLKDTDAQIGYLSLEFLLDLYEFYGTYFNLDLDIRNKLQRTAFKVIEKSCESDNVKDLETIETNQMEQLYVEMGKSNISSIPKKEELL